jgi:2-polyprenyl-3-methyl-5-hydroxy-6-metoxy-1,4-benzoquinol methylase/glycosyltransferase involved in cell wall biosynthesis
MSSDNTPEIAQRYADKFVEYTGPNGDWTREMEHFDDAAAARNKSFELATGKWIMWIDADDRLPGPDEAKKLLELNGRFKPEIAVRQIENEPERITLEGFLQMLDEKYPQITCIWAPYLYRKDKNGAALLWQERERIVRADAGWTWTEPGHEVLVPADSKKPQGYLRLEHLLFVHEKKWSNEDSLFNLRRHFKILLQKYEDGDRSVRTLRYLTMFAGQLAPERHEEWVDALLDAAASPVDICTARMAAGDWDASRGLYLTALAHYGAAIIVRGDIPDPYVQAARAAEKAEDWGRAFDFYSKALTKTPSYVDSVVTPRELELSLPLHAARAGQEYARQLNVVGRFGEALEILRMTVALAERVFKSPRLGVDREEASNFWHVARQEFESQVAATQIAELFEFLRKNDETLKAAQLLESAPHTLEDHPIIIKLQEKGRKVTRHLSSSKAYEAFYQSLSTTTDAIPTHEIRDEWLNPDGALPRAKELIAWLRANKPDARILEIGSYDGIVAIPILRALPDVKYVAVDASNQALSRCREYAEKWVTNPDRLETIQGTFFHGNQDLNIRVGEFFDVVVICEIVEHIPSPQDLIDTGLSLLAPGGVLFVSTPWGAFDRGSPDETDKPRDPRGHVRAMTMADMVKDVVSQGGEIDRLVRSQGRYGVGDTMHVVAKRGYNRPHWAPQPTHLIAPAPVSFAVPSALWDWNATHVLSTGIGASEKTIVFLARELAKADERQLVNVFGPVPEEEVHDRVRYWRREKLRHLTDSSKVVVSRAPSFGRQIEQMADCKLSKILWLQDAYYPDLTAETAADYEKIVVLTEWHKMQMHKLHGVPLEKMEIINNFLIPEHYAVPRPLRHPHHFIYASSPDRGLVRLLRFWPEVLKKWPDATLDIFYGWEGCMKLARSNEAWAVTYKKMRAEYDTLRLQSGVREVGRVNHATLALQFMQAAAWVYPSDFAETGCCTSLESMAGGCVPVCTPYAGLAETGASPWTQWVYMNLKEKDWCDDFIAALEKAVALDEGERAKMSAFALEKWSLATYALPRWQKLLRG